MEVTEQIQTFQQFIEIHCLAELLETIRKGQNFFNVDFIAMSKHSPELADLLLEQPEEVLKACELAISNFDLPKEIKQFHIRFQNLPEKHKIFIRNIRSEHINKLLVIEGTIRQKSDVRPQVTAARFECPSCGNVMNVLQLDSKFKEPSRCGCGRKGKFRLLSKELIDVQGIVLEEVTKDLEGGAQPKRINILLKQDLVSPMSDKKTNPGTSIQIVGILKEVPIILRSGGQSTKYDLLVEANNVIPLEEDYSAIEITPEEEEMIKKIAEDPQVYKKLATALAPGIYGHQKIKEALILQFAGGVKKVRDDGVITRGDIHVLLIGDPGAGKTIHGSSNIALSDGTYCTIKEFVDKKFTQNGEYQEYTHASVPSLNGLAKAEKKPIAGIWKRKAEQLYKIKTKTGKELICTETNPLFTAIPGSVKATKTKELVVGRWIALPRHIHIHGTRQEIRIQNKPVTITPDLARFFSYILAESYCLYNEAKKKYVIEFTNENDALVSDFMEIVSQQFNYTPKIYSYKKACKKVYVMNKEILHDLFILEPKIFKNSFEKTIPQCIMKSPSSVVSAFLSAFFECDGYVEKKHGLGITLASKEMIEQIQHLLLRFGIVSHTKAVKKYATNTIQKKQRTYWKLTIYGTHARIFAKKIGFLSQEKNTCLQEIVVRDDNPNLDVIPHLSTILPAVRSKLRMTQENMNIPRSTYQHFEKGDRNPSRKSLQKIVNALRIRVCELLLILQKAEEISLESNREIFHASQQEFSAMIGCSQTLVSQYEQNKILKEEDFDYTILKEKVRTILDDEVLFQQLNNLSLLATSNIFWDQILSIQPYHDSEEYIYDLHVDGTHNFIANNIYVHNSQLLKRSAVVAPKARFVSGKGVSGAGLTAAVVKDEFLSGWSLEAGAMVLANKGILMIDEMDKMSDDDRSAMHEGLEQQTISISKANIQATLRCETTILAAANPKFGRFDPYEPIAKQINMPPALINRFDLIFSIKDLPDKDKDEELAHFILTLHKKHQTEEVEVHTDLLRKYLIYARQKIVPKLSEQALEELKEYYVRMRSSGISEEKGIKAIPISPRQLEALVRLAEATAKIRLSDTITRKDAKYAINLLHYCLEQVGMDPETGKIDIDRISTGITTSERSKILGVREIIHELEEKLHAKSIAIEEIIKAAQEKGLSEDKVMESLEKLKRSGDLFEPRKGFISRI
jgi:replicative DNA helicase Mcm